jgi:hypothetical protein
MSTLAKELRKQLENTVLKAREEAERGAAAALESYGVGEAKKPTHLDKAGEDLRKKLRARGRQAGDLRRPDDSQEVCHLVQECAYEHWHRMLFARFLAENGLLIEPESGLDVDLDYCEEQARESKSDKWEVAASFAQRMLTSVFRLDDPVLQLRLPTEFRNRLTALLASLPSEVLTASDSLGWTYQFWQTKRKKEVNESGVKIGADELSPVTQLFTEDYMVDFLLDNTLGAWHAGKILAANPRLAETARSEDELRQAVALPGCPWNYLRFIQGKDGKWTPAAGTLDGWPKSAAALRALDPCMGSGHFVVAMFERLVALRMAEETLDEKAAVAAVIRDNLFGLELDPRCTQIGAFNLALAAWRRVGHCALPAMNLACSGLAPNTREADWLAIAGDNEKLQRGMQRLYRLFQKAAVLGSLIDPHSGESDLLVAAFHELQPLLERVLVQEAGDETAHEMAVTARGLAKAAEILGGQFTLIATNVPFKETKQLIVPLQEHIEEHFKDGKVNLATAFLLRIRKFMMARGTAAVVTPHEWLFLKSYTPTRETMLRRLAWSLLADLGENGFESQQAAGAFTALISFNNTPPQTTNSYAGWDVTKLKIPRDKAAGLLELQPMLVPQTDQLKNPDSRIGLSTASELPLLSKYAGSYVGLQNGDTPRFVCYFWEIPVLDSVWSPFELPCDSPKLFGGRNGILRWEKGVGVLASASYARVQGTEAWNRQGVAIRQTRTLPATRYTGELYDQSSAAIIPHNPAHLPAIWAYCSSPQFHDDVRKIDKKKNVTNATLVKVPFDLEHWQAVALERHPTGLPKPFSSDPTQWLFNGHPKGADHPLQVAVARLVGYRWPRQMGCSFPDCAAVDQDGLEKHADKDGVVCFSQARDEPPAAERLRALLADSYCADWSHALERKLIADTGSDAESLEEWLVNDFFQQHCEVFEKRPFIWHIWDGRKDGFNVLVNYHKLAEANGVGARTLETLTYAYLGDWLGRQKNAAERGEAGADGRLAAAQELQHELKNISSGEAPYDLFARWKPLYQQPIGWQPDINDGVRVNIRPFLSIDLNCGKKGAGVLRCKPGIAWESDRGAEPGGSKLDFPWHWSFDGQTKDFGGGAKFDGVRWNSCHYSLAHKQGIRESRRLHG